MCKCLTALTRLVLLSTLIVGDVASAQVIEVKGGTSTLFQSQGGTILLHGPGINASAGAGLVSGKFFGGAKLVKGTKRSQFILGVDNIPFDLSTDIFSAGHYLTGVGAGVRTEAHGTKLYAFLGATSTSFDSPFFEGVRAERPAAIFFASRKFERWSASTKTILSNQITTIGDLAWVPSSGTKIAAAAGIGSNHLYAATSLSITRPLYDLQAAYIIASDQFRRANVAVPLISEPIHENVLLTLRPFKSLSLSAGRQNYLTPLYPSDKSVKSTVDQGGVEAHILGASLTAMIFQSKYGDSTNIAMAYSASRTITPRIGAEATYMVSRPDLSTETDTFDVGIQEVLTPRWTILQVVNVSDGQSTFGFGGSFLSNFATVSADYQTYYVPSRTTAPFEQALILSAQIHPVDRLTLSGQTFVAPDGRLLYTTAMESTVSRQFAGNDGRGERHVSGDMLLRGIVMNEKGEPIAGAALLLDNLPVYTDSQGIFYVRERKRHAHTLRVLADQFLEGGSYHVISAPPAIESSIDEQAQTIIVVQRVSSRKD
ncbi:hypothetical protein [Granulicella arctica]|uniref:hypothetical protein n=1 Tax=Granulicella arctica TaxID=940613 RepID=UPI0021DFAA05|nr:hypothetical protein [Granulicella arctica]